jgi:PAS domain-containing protein
MSSSQIEENNKRNLRSRAHARLTGDAKSASAGASASAALGVLHELASSPDTASDALALLHELQVHQVELDLQADELRGTRTELEAALVRQIQLYDFAPMGLFTVDRQTCVHEANLTGAQMLGIDRDALIGQDLDQFIATPGKSMLRSLLVNAADTPAAPNTCTLQLTTQPTESRQMPPFVQASVRVDPAGGHYFVALCAITQPASP